MAFLTTLNRQLEITGGDPVNAAPAPAPAPAVSPTGFDPSKSLSYGGKQWTFDTAEARNQAFIAAANSENGQENYGNQLTTGYLPMVRSLGYTGPSPFIQDYTSGANEQVDQAGLAAGQAAFNQFLASKGYTLGTAWGEAGNSPFGTSSAKYQQYFDANGNPVGQQGYVSGDNGLKLISPILMAAGAAAAGIGGAGAGAADGGSVALSSADKAALFGDVGYGGAGTMPSSLGVGGALGGGGSASAEAGSQVGDMLANYGNEGLHYASGGLDAATASPINSSVGLGDLPAASYSNEGAHYGTVDPSTGQVTGGLPTSASPINSSSGFNLTDLASKIAKAIGANPGQALTLAGMLGAGAAGAGVGGGASAAPAASLPSLATVNTSVPSAANDPTLQGAKSAATSLRDKTTAEADANLAANKAAAAKVNATSDAAVQQQLSAAANAGTLNNVTLDDYLNTYRQTGLKYATDAMSKGGAADQARVAGQAATDVQRQFENAKAQQQRSMASMGVNPGGSTYQANADAVRLAAARAGAVNTARQNAIDQGDAMRLNAAQLGNTVGNLSLSAGANAGNLAAQAANTSTIPVTTNNAVNATYNNGLATAGTLNNSAGNLSLAGLGLDLDASRLNAALTQQNNQNSMDLWKAGEQTREFNANLARGLTQDATKASNDTASGIGSAVKWGVDNWGNLSNIFGSIFSDENMKDVGDKADGSKDLKAVRDMDVRHWSYKPETGLTSMAQQGVMAQDFKKKTGMGDGHTIPVAAALGVLTSAVQKLDEKVSKKEKA